MWPFATDSLTEAAFILRRLAWADGTDDHVKDGHALLAAALPAGSVGEVPGGHSIKTFQAVWKKLLAKVPFCDARYGIGYGIGRR